MPDALPPSRPRRRWRVFSLRTLMVFILGFGVTLGWWVNSAREQAAALATIRAFDRNASVTYEDQPSGISRLIPVASWREAFERRWPPTWLERSLGENYTKNINSLVYGALVPPETDPKLARQALSAVPRLRGLVLLSIYARMTDADIEPLTRLAALHSLRLAGECSGLTDMGCRSLSGLTSLHHLMIDNAPITDAGLTSLAKLPHLTTLSLNGSEADRSEPSLFAVAGTGLAGLKHLRNLDLRSAALNGSTLRHMGRLPDLQNLWFAGNAITDDDLRALAPLTNLKWLEIHDSRINGTGFRALTGQTRLNRLTLHNAPITDQGAAFLARLPALQTVNLDSTHLTTAGLQVLQAAPSITSLTVKPNPPVDRPPLDLDPLPNAAPGGIGATTP